MRPHSIFPITSLALLLSLAACDSGEKPADKTVEVDKKVAVEKKPDADKKVEKTEAEKQEEGRKRNVERLQKLTEGEAEEAKRWTDELKAGVKTLASKKFKNAKDAVAAILASPHRAPKNSARDAFRHPAEVLEFFGVTPKMTVVEVGPGAGWYTEILAPLLVNKGKLIITDYDPNGPDHSYTMFIGKRMEAFLARSPELYGKIERVQQSEDGPLKLGDEASVDMVFLVRTVHGWQNGGTIDANFKEVHRALKKDGVVALIQHRAKADAKVEESAKGGYLPEAWLVEKMKGLGFDLVEKSEINANPKDTTDYEKGVWTLPPTLALKDKDKDKYTAIGESDRMTLKFKKRG
jgi:predicted methyltransferase